MPDLKSEVGALRDRRLGRLAGLHDDYEFTRKLWTTVWVSVKRYGERFSLENAVTGTRASEADLVGRAGGAIIRLREQSFKSIVGQFELFAGELLRAWLTAHPEEVDRKTVELRTLLSSTSLADVQRAALGEAIESTILEKAYARPVKWFSYLRTLLGRPAAADADVARFSELKATRDVIEHAEGVASSTYVEKSGSAARFRVGEVVTVDAAYHEGAYHFVGTLIADVANQAIAAV